MRVADGAFFGCDKISKITGRRQYTKPGTESGDHCEGLATIGATKMPETESYKIKKGDTLGSIAKQFGHKKWETIWNARENKPLVSKRKKPEAIQPGDQLTIPPNEKQQKEEELNLKQTQQLQQSLESQTAKLKEQIKIYDDLIKQNQEMNEQILKELEDSLKGMKKWSKGVDAAATVATGLLGMRKEIAKLGSLGKKAFGAKGEALKKIGKEVGDQVKDIMKDQSKDQAKEKAVKFVAEHKESSNAIVALVGITADSFDKMTSPSFWAGTAVQLMDGKSWSEAVSTDITEEIEQRIKTVQTQAAQSMKELEAKRNQLAGQLQEAQKFGKHIGQQKRLP
jgi:LysM domain